MDAVKHRFDTEFCEDTRGERDCILRKERELERRLAGVRVKTGELVNGEKDRTRDFERQRRDMHEVCVSESKDDSGGVRRGFRSSGRIRVAS